MQAGREVRKSNDPPSARPELEQRSQTQAPRPQQAGARRFFGLACCRPSLRMQVRIIGHQSLGTSGGDQAVVGGEERQ